MGGPCPEQHTLGFYELFKTLSLEAFIFFFLSQPHKTAFCSVEINVVYMREAFPATVGFALNPVSRSLILLWVSLVYLLSYKWRIEL